MRQMERVGRGIAALVLVGLYAMAVETLSVAMPRPAFLLVSAAVLALIWHLADTTPHSVRYVAAPPRPVDERERLALGDILLIAAAVIVLAAVCADVLPALLR